MSTIETLDKVNNKDVNDVILLRLLTTFVLFHAFQKQPYLDVPQNIHRKAPVLESAFNKVAGLMAAT